MACLDLRRQYRVNEDPEDLIKNMAGFALDMDGTMYFDETWIPGAVDFLKKVDETGRKYCFMTNNSSKGADAYISKLHRMGLDIDPETQLVSSGMATIAYLKREYPGKRVFLFGNKVLINEFEQAGINIVSGSPDIIVTAFAQEFDYKGLSELCDMLSKGVPFIGTHPDLVCPTKNYSCGYMPDIGALHAFIKAATGREPEKIIGKPNSEIIDYTLNIMGTDRSGTAVIGDRLYTDVRSGVNNGLTGIFVLSGEGTLEDIEKMHIMPDLVFDSVKDIVDLL